MKTETHDLVKDSKAKVIHHVNHETGESFVTYKTVYLLQSKQDQRLQQKITKVEANKIAKANGLTLDSLPECFNWSSLKK